MRNNRGQYIPHGQGRVTHGRLLLFVLLGCLLLAPPCIVLAAANNCELDYPDQCSPLPFDWDWQSTTIQIEPTSSGTVAVTGGKGPYTWTIRGNGFFLDEAGSLKTITTTTSTAVVYTRNACGSAEIVATDSCGNTVKGEIKSSQGVWVYLGGRIFRALNVYKPDEHGMFPTNVNGYGYSVPGRIYSSGKRYCMSKTNPGTVAEEYWGYSTWVMYTAPDGRYGHWAACRSHVGETVKDPIVGVIDIPVFGKTDVLENYGGCQNFHRHYALTGDFFIWEWKCGN